MIGGGRGGGGGGGGEEIYSARTPFYRASVMLRPGHSHSREPAWEGVGWGGGGYR